MTSTIIDPFNGIEYKSVETQARTSETTDLGDGVIEAIVSVTNLRDNVGDVILPGAYEKSLRDRTPKGVWHHSWTDPIAKTQEVKELLPGDPLLPSTLPDGKPWPADAGALYVKMEFNLNTDRGRTAYEDVKFFGDSQEWSIGYKVGQNKAYKKRDTRYIRELDLYEYSPVLFGAMSSARTTTVKDAQLAYKSLFEASQEGPTTMHDEKSIIEVKAAMTVFADAFRDVTLALKSLVEGGEGTGSSIVDLAEALGVSEELLHDFDDAIDSGDLVDAESKALPIMVALDDQTGDDVAEVLEYLGTELKSLKPRPRPDEDDEDEDDFEDPDDEDDDPSLGYADPDDEEEDDEDDEDEDLPRKPPRKPSKGETKSIPMEEFSKYL